MKTISKSNGEFDGKTCPISLLLIIKGVNVFPTQIESVLFNIDGTQPHYRIILERENHQDKATVMVEAQESLYSDRMSKQRELIGTIRKQLSSELGIGVAVKVVKKNAQAL